MIEEPLRQPEPSDEILISQVVRRDVTAFSAIYERYARPIYTMASHMLGATEAEEIVQEVFLRLWNRADQFEPKRGRFKSWFMAIARHRIVDALRLRHQQQRLIAAEDIDLLLAGLADPLINVEEEVWLREDSGPFCRQSNNCRKNSDESSFWPILAA